MRLCLHKHDDYCDITTYGDFAKYKAVLLCIQCGGQRLISREPEEEWIKNISS